MLTIKDWCDAISASLPPVFRHRADLSLGSVLGWLLPIVQIALGNGTIRAEDRLKLNLTVQLNKATPKSVLAPQGDDLRARYFLSYSLNCSYSRESGGYYRTYKNYRSLLSGPSCVIEVNIPNPLGRGSHQASDFLEAATILVQADGPPAAWLAWTAFPYMRTDPPNKRSGCRPQATGRPMIFATDAAWQAALAGLEADYELHVHGGWEKLRRYAAVQPLELLPADQDEDVPDDGFPEYTAADYLWEGLSAHFTTALRIRAPYRYDLDRAFIDLYLPEVSPTTGVSLSMSARVGISLDWRHENPRINAHTLEQLMRRASMYLSDEYAPGERLELIARELARGTMLSVGLERDSWYSQDREPSWRLRGARAPIDDLRVEDSILQPDAGDLTSYVAMIRVIYDWLSDISVERGLGNLPVPGGDISAMLCVRPSVVLAVGLEDKRPRTWWHWLVAILDNSLLGYNGSRSHLRNEVRLNFGLKPEHHLLGVGFDED